MEAAHFVGPTNERQKVTFYINTYKLGIAKPVTG
jgi:hypothetical protein